MLSSVATKAQPSHCCQITPLALPCDVLVATAAGSVGRSTRGAGDNHDETTLERAPPPRFTLAALTTLTSQAFEPFV